MRFAILGNAASSLGNFRAPLIADIVSKGHEVFALAPDFTSRDRALMISLGAYPIDYSLKRTGLNPCADFADLAALRKVLARLQLDSLLSFGIKPAIYGTIAANSVGVPARHVLITGLGYAFTDGAEFSIRRHLVSLVARHLYRFALRRAQTVFVQNRDDAKDFVRMQIVGSEKLVTVNGTGVELDKWCPVPPVSSPLTFLLAARMLRDKGVAEFVEAARIVRSLYPSVRFVLAGGVDTNPEAIRPEQLRTWAAEGVIEWKGHVDMRTWLAQSSVFVLPSYREGVPRSSQEAMAMGRAIVTTDAPGCRETVIDGRNGFLVPPRNPKALAEAMMRFIVNTELVMSMGRESREIAESRFDVRAINAAMIRTMGLD